MKLGAYTFAWDPDRWTPPVPEKRQGIVLTLDGAGYFSWGANIVGKEIEMEWRFMSLAQFDSIVALLTADETVLWDLDVAGMSNYYVEVMSVDPELPDVTGYDQGYMHNVRVSLFILQETAAGTS